MALPVKRQNILSLFSIKSVSYTHLCDQCKWFQYCCGGCRAVGLALTNDKFGVDKFKCTFFEKGYLEKLAEALPDYKSLVNLKL